MNLVFDLDGTLTFDGKTIDSEIIDAIRAVKQAGAEIIFASARPYRDIIPLLPDDLRASYIVGLNGAMVFYEEKLLEFHEIEKEIYLRLVRYAIENNLPFFIDDIFDYGVYRKEHVIFFPFVDVLRVAKERQLYEISHPLKAVIFVKEGLLTQELIKLADEEKSALMYHEGEGILYVNPKNISKATVTERLFSDFVCFGNDKNDIELFKKAKYSVMVGDYEPLREFSDERVAAEPNEVAKKIREVGRKPFKNFRS